MRRKQIKLCVLEVLEQCGSYALPESTLKSHVRGLLRPVPNDGEWSESLDWLDTNGAMVNVPDGMGGDEQQWAITEKGKVMLRQAP